MLCEGGPGYGTRRMRPRRICGDPICPNRGQNAGGLRIYNGIGMSLNSPTIGDLAKGRDNNFNLLRFLAASAVLLSHSWPLALGTNESEPLAQIFPQLTLGTSAVIVFFAISGFLISSSWDRSRDPRAFLIARVLRIYPGLLVMLLLSVIVFGPLMTTHSIPAYFGRFATWTYLPSNLLLVKSQLSLPGVLERSPYNVLNGSLWTLGYEVTCYLALLLAGISGGLKQKTFRLTLLAFILIGFALWQVPGSNDRGFANKVLLLGPAFLVGTCAWNWRDKIPLSGPLALLLGAACSGAMLYGLPLAHLLFSIAVTYGSLYVAFVPKGYVRKFSKGGDFSYGMYIYAFPIQQLVHFFLPEAGVLRMFVIAFAATLCCAALSWTYVERSAIEWGKVHLKARWEGASRGAVATSSRPL